MTFGSLFAGIGGFDLGFERAGLKCEWQVEIDPFCLKVLAKHWPAVRRHHDVRTFPNGDLDQWNVDVICGGFPCQDLSKAGRFSGKRLGLQGERSGLWREYLRIIRVLRPRFVVVENTTALLAGPLATVLGDLAEIGFDAEWHCLPAAAVGAPHIRDRCFVLAYAEGGRVRHAGRGPIARPTAEVQRATGEWEGLWAESRPVGEGTGARGDGEITHWGLEPGVRRVAHGVSNRVDRNRNKGIGNAVVPQVAEWIGRRLMEVAA